jgi:hypothetical protein
MDTLIQINTTIEIIQVAGSASAQTASVNGLGDQLEVEPVDAVFAGVQPEVPACTPCKAAADENIQALEILVRRRRGYIDPVHLASELGVKLQPLLRRLDILVSEGLARRDVDYRGRPLFEAMPKAHAQVGSNSKKLDWWRHVLTPIVVAAITAAATLVGRHYLPGVSRGIFAPSSTIVAWSGT